MILTQGEIEVSIKLDNGEMVYIETLHPGSHIGINSVLIGAQTMFHFKAKTITVTVHQFSAEKIQFLREILLDLDDALGLIEEYNYENEMP
jgi:CRP-like cAMP-binding protein